MNAPRELTRPTPRARYATALQRIDRLIEREILRLRARYALSLDEFRGLYVSDAQVDALVAEQRDGGDLARIDTLTQQARDLARQLRAQRPGGPWAALRQALALGSVEEDIALLALAPEIDPRYETLYAYLNNDAARRWLTPELAARLIGDDDPLAVRAAFAPDGTLVASGVLLGAGAVDSPRAQRGWRLAPSLADWLLGLPWSDERLPPRVATAWLGDGGGAGLEDAGVPAACRPAARRIAAQWSARRSGATVIVAAAADDALYLALRLVEETAGQALQLDVYGLRSLATPADAAQAASLQARARGQVLICGPLDGAFDAEGRPIEALLGALRRLDERLPCVFTTSASAPWRELVQGLGYAQPVAELRVPELDPAQRAALWHAALDGHAAEADTQALADRFALGPERIRRAAQRAREAVLHEGLPVDAACLAAARAVSGEGGGVTRRIETSLHWDDLVLPAPVMSRLRDVLRAIELRPRVLDDWGMARRLGGSRSINVMFAGVSGTGKTMAAGLIARTLGLDLHRVELAAVVSKYIGETEKNLDRAFEAARRANAILFIDEADALLGKRSEVKDAHDRHANVEIAYLLQKMEDHDGVVVVATNLASNIDDAFSRRMQFMVEFPLPDATGRERLWRGMIPPGLPLGADVDLGFLARQFTLAGGDIRNVVLDAAYAAAARDDALSMRDLVQAVARQQAKRGRAMDRMQLREYAALLQA
jgi:hypothetical protein